MGTAPSDPIIWALVMNAARLRILRGLTETAPAELIGTSPARHLRQILGGASLDGSAAIDRDLQDFVRETLASLAALRRAGDFKHLVLIAPAPVMTCIEAEMPAQLEPAVRWRHAADLVGLSKPGLRRIVQTLVAQDPLG